MTSGISRIAAAALAAAACFGAASPAHAGSFTATPIKLTIPAGGTSTSLSLDNVGDEPVLVQAEVMAWSQHEGRDVLTPSDDLVVSPPIFKVPPGGQQTVRVGVLHRRAHDIEGTYRLFLQEVPQTPKPGAQGITVALRLGLPVFLPARADAAPRVSWRAQLGKDQIRLTLVNSGNAHLQALHCKLYDERGVLVGEQDLGAYVLAGRERAWTVPLRNGWRGGTLRLLAQTSAGELSSTVVPE